MNHRVKAHFDSFLVAENEHMVFEKALYSLLDRFKSDRINNSSANYPIDYNKQIEACFTKLKMHTNYRNNFRFFEIEAPNNEVDPVQEILGVSGEEEAAVA